MANLRHMEIGTNFSIPKLPIRDEKQWRRKYLRALNISIVDVNHISPTRDRTNRKLNKHRPHSQSSIDTRRSSVRDIRHISSPICIPNPTKFSSLHETERLRRAPSQESPSNYELFKLDISSDDEPHGLYGEEIFDMEGIYSEEQQEDSLVRSLQDRYHEMDVTSRHSFAYEYNTYQDTHFQMEWNDYDTRNQSIHLNEQQLQSTKHNLSASFIPPHQLVERERLSRALAPKRRPLGI